MEPKFKDHLEKMHALRSKFGSDTNPTIESLLLEYGVTPKVMRPAYPRIHRRYQIKNRCFQNCMTLVLSGEYPGFRYYQGFAFVQGLLSIEHAWLYDEKTGDFYDPTLGRKSRIPYMPKPGEYRGVEINIDDLLKFIRETRRYGLHANELAEYMMEIRK